MSEPSEAMQRFLAKWREIPFRPLTEMQRAEIWRSRQGKAGTAKQKRQREAAGEGHIWFAGATNDKPKDKPRKRKSPAARGVMRLPEPRRTPASLRTQTKPCASIVCDQSFAPDPDEKLSEWQKRQYCCRDCYVADKNARALNKRLGTAGDDPVTARMAYGGPFTREDLLSLKSGRTTRSIKDLLENWKRVGLIEVVEPSGKPLWGLTALGRASFGQSDE